MKNPGIILLLLLAAAWVGYGSPMQQRAPLTLVQLEQLLAVKMPDGALSNEISARGLAFPLYQSVLATLESRGVGPLTLQSLRQYLIHTGIVVSTVPPVEGCEVIVGSNTYSTDKEGRVTMEDLAPGIYDAVIRKLPQYKEQHFGIRVVDKVSVMEVRLIGNKGILSISGTVKEAQVEIKGRPVRGPVSRLEVDPGTYRIRITAPFREAFSKDVVIQRGDDVALSPELKVDPVALSQLRSEAMFALKSKSYRDAAAKSEAWLALAPTEPEPLSVLAEVYYQIDQFDKAFQFGSRALAAGGTLEFNLIHHHTLIYPIHAAVLALGAKSLGFRP